MERFDRYYRPGLYKFILIFLLFVNTGFFTAFYAVLPELHDKDTRSREEIAAVSIQVATFVDNKAKEAKEKVAMGGVYSPYDYFRDLDEIQGIQKVLSFHTYVSLSPLQALMDNSLKQGFTYHDIEKARDTFKDNLFDELSHRSEFMEGMKQLGWLGFLSWLLSVYLWNLLPVLLLYLVWMWESQRYREHVFRYPEPLNLIWQVIAHPFFLTRIFWRWLTKKGREFYVEAEYRRTKEKMFVYLTEREERKIKNFAQNGLPIQVWRQLLKLKGLKPAHSLAVALLVTMIFTVLPRPAEAKSKQLKDVSLVAMSWQDDSIHLARMSIAADDNEMNTTWDCEEDRTLQKEDFVFTHIPDGVLLMFNKIHFYFQEVWCDIMHVPLLGSKLQTVSISHRCD